MANVEVVQGDRHAPRFSHADAPNSTLIENVDNPYSPPPLENSSPLPVGNRLRFVWIWMGLIYPGLLCVIPPDVYSIWRGLVFCLACFLFGVTYRPNHRLWLALVSVPLAGVAGAMAINLWTPVYEVIFACAMAFAAIQIWLGIGASADIQKGRSIVFLALTVAYCSGLSLWPLAFPLAVPLLTVIAVFVANRHVSMGR